MNNAQQAAYTGTLFAEAGEDSSKVSNVTLGLTICLHCRAKAFPRSDLLW